MRFLLETLIQEFQDKIQFFTGGIPRITKFTEISDKIRVVIGMRRTGKTYFLLQIIHNLLKSVSSRRILYLNFEDDRLFPMAGEQFATLIDEFYSLYPENHDEICYLFFDEIQNIEGWERVIRRYFDTKKVRIYLTGPSAKLLSKEIATSLRGRSIATEMWPFSFTEFLEAQTINPSLNIRGKKDLDQFKKHLTSYLEQGGFPETMAMTSADRIRILQDYVSVVIFRDIVERHKITNISLIRYMIKVLVKNIGCGFSVNKLFNDLKSQGFAVSKTTIYDYLEYVEDAYLTFTVSLYAESVRKTQTNLRKLYAIDTGLVSAYSMSLSKNLGHYFENLIYLDLKRAGHEIYYYLTKARREVDFFTRDAQGLSHLYQVSWDIDDPQTLKRELTALHEAEDELGIQGELITPDIYLTSFLSQIQT
jgi:predicted AAA+ superfamily ATPase